MISTLILSIFYVIIVSNLALVQKYGIVTYPPERQGGKAPTTDDLHIKLRWDNEIMQCTIQPSSFSTWYWCYPDYDSSSYCYDSSLSTGGGMTFTMEGTDGVWIGDVSVVMIDGTEYGPGHYCATGDGDDKISIPGSTDLTATNCDYWNSLRAYEFFCVSAGSDCNYNDYVRMDIVPAAGNDARINGDYTNRYPRRTVLTDDYTCDNVCVDAFYCNGVESWDPVALECKPGDAVTCPLHSYCDNDAATCLRDCDSFAIDEYLTQCSVEFNENEVQVGNLQSDLTALTLRVDSHDIFETDIDSLQSSINALTQRIDNHDTSITDINNEITEALNNINDAISGLQTSIALYDTELTTIEATITTIQNDIEILDNQITDFGPYVPPSQQDDQPQQADDKSINWLNNNNNNNNDNYISFKNYLIIILLVLNAFSLIIGYYCCFSYSTNNVKRYLGVPQATTDTDY